MQVIQNIRYCMRNYWNFSGRSSRSQYRDFRIFSVIPMLVFASWMTFIVPMKEYPYDYSLPETLVGWTLLLWWAALVIPAMATTSRRFHDFDYSGAWTVVPIGLLTYALAGVFDLALMGTVKRSHIYAAGTYPIIIIFLMAKKGSPGENYFGPNPSTETSD